jgi:succinate dehydrogenase / fumarate reductase cytochrome b subunit
MATAAGPDAYATFTSAATHWAGIVILVGLTWAFFQKTFAGIRHLVMDTGMGFELKANKLGAVLTIIASVLATALLWAYWLGALK